MDKDDSACYFEVENILDQRNTGPYTEYLIKWKNYDDSQNSWEPEDNLNCPELFKQFKEKYARDNSSSSSSINTPAKPHQTSKQGTSSPTLKTASLVVSSEQTHIQSHAHRVKSAPTAPLVKPVSPTKPKNASGNKSTLIDREEPHKSQFGILKRPQKIAQLPKNDNLLDDLFNKIQGVPNRPGISSSSSPTSSKFPSKSATTAYDPQISTGSKYTSTQSKSHLDLDKKYPRSEGQTAAPELKISASSNRQSWQSIPTKPIRSDYGRSDNATGGSKIVEYDSRADYNKALQRPESSRQAETRPFNWNAPNQSHPTAYQKGKWNTQSQPEQSRLSSTSHSATSQKQTPQGNPPQTTPEAVTSPQPPPQKLTATYQWEGLITTPKSGFGTFNISSIMGTLKDDNDIRSFIKQCELETKSNGLKVKRTVSFDTIQKTINDEKVPMFSVTTTANTVALGKMRTFMETGKLGLMIFPETSKKEILILLPCSSDLAKSLGFPSDKFGICAVYLGGVPERPSTEIMTRFKGCPIIDMKTADLQRVFYLLNFPSELSEKIHRGEKIQIIGESVYAKLLKEAYSKIKITTKGPASIVLIDRHLLTPQPEFRRYKKSAINMYEFGAPGDVAKDVPPVLPIFPRDTGGYITTDAVNLAKDPLLISKIVKFAKQFNGENPLRNIEVVFQDDIIDIIEDVCKAHPDKKQSLEAKTMLGMHNTMENIKFLRIWPGVTYKNAKLATAEWMTKLASHEKERRQLFIYVDDNEVIKAKKYQALDLTKSDRLDSFLKKQ